MGQLLAGTVLVFGIYTWLDSMDSMRRSAGQSAAIRAPETIWDCEPWVAKFENELVQQLKDILNTLYPQEDASAAAAPTDAESPASTAATPTEVGAAPAPTDAESPASTAATPPEVAAAPAPTDAESPASTAATPPEVAAAPAPTDAKASASEVDGDGVDVVMLGTLAFSNTWPAVLKECMESYDPQYDYQSCWVKGGGFVIGFKEPWELEHVPAKCQFPLSVYAAVVSEAPGSSTDTACAATEAPASAGVRTEAAPGDSAKDGWEEPCGSHVDQMDTLPLESNGAESYEDPKKNHVTVLSGDFNSLPVNMSRHPPVSSMPLKENIAAAPADPEQDMEEVRANAKAASKKRDAGEEPGAVRRGRPRGSRNAADADNLPGTTQPSKPSKATRGKGRRKGKEPTKPDEMEDSKEPKEMEDSREPEDMEDTKEPEETKEHKEKKPKAKAKGKAAAKKYPQRKAAAKTASKKTDNSKQVVGA
eukprot:s831_g24.t1